MWNLKKTVLDAAEAAGIQISELSADECQHTRATILNRYTECAGRWPTWIWEHFTDAVALADEDGWRWIGDYCADEETIMLFADEDEPGMLQFPAGRTVAEVVGECCGFEYYLTNRPVDFVLCFNHHDCIIATGDAMDWLEEERAKRKTDHQ